jgi:hypothetical protein
MLKFTTQLTLAGAAGLVLLLTAPLGCAQDRNRDNDRDRSSDRDRYWDNNRHIYTRLMPGTNIPVRLKQAIDVNRSDNRVYYGTVADDIRGENGRIAVPRGANAELMVRVERDNDLILDLESLVVNGQRYAIQSGPNRVESQRDNSLVGAIVGAVSGGEVQGRAVRIPRNAVVTFRLDRPLDVGVADRGVDRGGYHYHDWYNDRGRDQDRR